MVFNNYSHSSLLADLQQSAIKTDLFFFFFGGGGDILKNVANKKTAGWKLLVSLLRKAALSSNIDLSQNYRSQSLNE